MAPPAGLEPAIFGLGDRRLAIRPQGPAMGIDFLAKNRFVNLKPNLPFTVE